MALHLLWDRLLHLDVPLILLGMFLLRRAAYKAYRLFVYPYFASPLRNLPGPKVSNQQTCTHKIMQRLTWTHEEPPLPHRAHAQPVSERPSQSAVCVMDAEMAHGAADPVL